MKKQILLFVLISLMVSLSFSSDDEVDYSRLYRNLKSSLNPLDISKVKSQLLTDDSEISNVLEGAMNTFNIFAPYTKMDKSLREVIAELANFQFTLRSAISTNIYQSAVPATVLIVAPAAEAIGAGFVIDESKGLILTNYHVTSGLKSLLVAFYEEDNGLSSPKIALKWESKSCCHFQQSADHSQKQVDSTSPPPSALAPCQVGGQSLVGHLLAILR